MSNEQPVTYTSGAGDTSNLQGFYEPISVTPEAVKLTTLRDDLAAVEELTQQLGADVDDLSAQLRIIQETATPVPYSNVTTSARFDKIIGALAKAQGEIENATKDSKNPHFQSSYADLASGFNAIRRAFSNNGIAYTQTLKPSAGVNNELTLYSRLWHADQWLETEWPSLKTGGTPQQRGSDLTYAKRYSLFSIAGIAGEDDDGNEASSRAPSRQEAPPSAMRAQRSAPAAKREEAPREPSLSDDASSTLLATLLATLQVCESREAIVKWSAANSNDKGKLTAVDQAKLKDAFVARQTAVKAPMSASPTEEKGEEKAAA